MNRKAPGELENVFEAFSKKLDSASKPQAKQAPVFQASPHDILGALRRLSESPTGQMPFPQFTEILPGDEVESVRAAIDLMTKGWITLDPQQGNAVKITDAGRTASDIAGLISPP